MLRSHNWKGFFHENIGCLIKSILLTECWLGLSYEPIHIEYIANIKALVFMPHAGPNIKYFITLFYKFTTLIELWIQR